MDYWITDIDIIESTRRSEIEKLSRKQYSRKCNACKKGFVSGNQLFKHLASHPHHKCDIHHVSYTIKCRKHSDFCEYRWLCIPKDHYIPILNEQSCFTVCKDVYIDSVQIMPYYRENELYSITDFDQNDMI